MRRMILALLFSLMFSTTADAQRIGELQQGARVRVTGFDGKDEKGTITMITGESISLDLGSAKGVTTVPLSTVQSIEVGYRNHIKGLAIGALFGTFVGALTGAAIGLNDNSCQLMSCGSAENAKLDAGVLGVYGLALGSCIGGLIGLPSWERVTVPPSGR